MPAQTIGDKAPAESKTTKKEGTEAGPKPESDTTSPGTLDQCKVTNENRTAHSASKEMASETPKTSDGPTEKAAPGEGKLKSEVDDKMGPTTAEEPAPPAPQSNARNNVAEVVSTGGKSDIPTSKESKSPGQVSEAKNGNDIMKVQKPADGEKDKAGIMEKPNAAEAPDTSMVLPGLSKTETTGKADNSDDNPKHLKVKFGAVEKVDVEEEDDEYKPDDDEDAEDDYNGEDGEIAEGDEPLLDLKSLPPGLTTSLLEKGGISTLLHEPASKGNIDELRALLAKDGEMEGKVDDRDVYQYTALHVAAENDRLEACKLLIEHGADVEASTKMHESKPIHYAAIEGHDEIISVLLERGANINALTDDNRTALYLAAMRGHDHCVSLLLEKGANRDLADKDGKKPVDVADKQAVVDLLISPPAKKARTE